MLVSQLTFGSVLSQVREAAAAGHVLWVDCETSGLDPWGARGKAPDQVVGIAVGIPGSEFYFPVGHAYGENLSPGMVQDLIAALNSAPVLGNWNIKFDLNMMRSLGLKRPKRILDPIILAQLMDENNSLKLKTVAPRYLGYGAEDQNELDEKLVLWGLTKAEMWRLPPSAVEPYACTDVRLPPLVQAKLIEMLGPKQEALWMEINELILHIYDMEVNGITIDRSHIPTLVQYTHERMLKVDAKLKEMFGPGFNPNSPKQVKARLHLPDSKEETLELSKHPAAPLILEYRGLSKATSSYYDPYEKLSYPDGRIHSNFNPTGTVSGRLSSRDPNVQAVPVWDSEQRVKELFISRHPESHVLVEADYSQAELRMAAVDTRDEELIRAIAEGKDLHQATADATGLDRDTAKRINFSVVYGIGAPKLAINLKVPEKKAYEFLQTYHGTYPGFRNQARVAEKIARERGYIRLWTGRLQHFNTPDAETRKAFSRRVQGGVAEMVRVAMTKVAPIVNDAGGYIINQVHDSLWMELPRNSVDELIPIIRGAMEDQPQFDVPFKVDVKKGDNMAKMEKVPR